MTKADSSHSFSRKHELIISEFLGIPGRDCNFSQKDPLSIEDLVTHFINRYDLERAKPEQILVESWEVVFGSFSERCYPVKLTDSGTLIISVTNSTLRSEIIFKKNELLGRIQKLNYCEGIKDLAVRA
ncbi:MAG: DciA family protein [Coraliomargaritaceae bacterium]